MTATTARPALFCPIADRHRDLRVAADACAGRFTHCGVTLELGLPPDWRRADLPEDAEWRIECSKFLWALDLAHAYETTARARFRDAWEMLVETWIAQVPSGSDSTEVAARRLQNWVYARQRLGTTPSLDNRLAEEVACVLEDLTPARNHRTLELHGLLVAALGVAELDPDGSLAELAVTELRANLEADFHADGVHREASTHYHALVLRSLVSALENGRRFGLDFGRRYEQQLARACEFLLHARRPDGIVPALSDADSDDHGDVLELAGRLLGRADLAAAPEACNVSFPYGGYYVQRSGWDADARFLIFDCGPLGAGGHGHYDALSVEVFAHGAPLVVDPGRFTYSEGRPNLRRWFRGTAAHNTVTVDDLDQTRYTRGKPKGPVAKASAGHRTTGAGLDVLRGVVRSPEYSAVHARTVVFVDAAYWIVEDVLQSDELHRYDLRFHLPPVAARLDGSRIETPSAVLELQGADDVTLEQGWVSPSYGTRVAAPVVRATRTASTALFTTLLTPRRSTGATSQLRVLDRGRVEVVGAHGRDAVTWSATSASWRREALR